MSMKVLKKQNYNDVCVRVCVAVSAAASESVSAQRIHFSSPSTTSACEGRSRINTPVQRFCTAFTRSSLTLFPFLHTSVHVQILQMKVNRLEDLVLLKDMRIQDLTQHLETYKTKGKA